MTASSDAPSRGGRSLASFGADPQNAQAAQSLKIASLVLRPIPSRRVFPTQSATSDQRRRFQAAGDRLQTAPKAKQS